MNNQDTRFTSLPHLLGAPPLGTYVRSHIIPTLGGATAFSFPMDPGTEGNDSSPHGHWLDESSRPPAPPVDIGVGAGAGVGASTDITIREFCASVMEQASALEDERAMDIAVAVESRRGFSTALDNAIIILIKRLYGRALPGCRPTGGRVRSGN